MTRDSVVRDLTRERMIRILPELVRLESNWTEIGEAPWKQEDFLLDLPDKWRLSFYIEKDNHIVGYAIVSRDAETGKLNKILVDRDQRGHGIGKAIWDEYLRRLRTLSLLRAEFKVHVDNVAAISLYKKSGCSFYGKETGPDGRDRYLCRYVLRLGSRVRHSSPTLDLSDHQSLLAACTNRELAGGNIVREFEHAVSGFIGKRFGIATDNGTNALYLALRALGIDENSEVILPSYACYSLLSTVLHCRAKPVFADINNNDHNVSFESVRSKISNRTGAIILPHMFGNPIKDIARHKSLGIPVIEDCAQSLGSSVNGVKTGDFGDITVCSFYATKLMTTGLGGMVLTSDERIHARLLDLTRYDNRDGLGECYNYRMSDLSAALGLSQMKRLDEFLSLRRKIAVLYNEQLKGTEYETAFEPDNIYYRYILMTKDTMRMRSSLTMRGIEVARPIYKPLHQYMGLDDREFPHTMSAQSMALSLPLYPAMSLRDAGDVISAILNWKQEMPISKEGDTN